VDSTGPNTGRQEALVDDNEHNLELNYAYCCFICVQFKSWVIKDLV